jgi:predicted nucleic acid-binding protein
VRFVDLSATESIFLDANPLVYHFAPDPLFGAACTQLIARAGKGEILAFTSTHVLSEVAHHLMTLEASALFGWTSKVVDHLKKQPTAIQNLTNFRQAIEKIPQLGIQVLTVPSGLIASAAVVSQQTGLLANDALIVAVMQSHGLTNLASHDTDFDRVPGITRYGPG